MTKLGEKLFKLTRMQREAYKVELKHQYFKDLQSMINVSLDDIMGKICIVQRPNGLFCTVLFNEDGYHLLRFSAHYAPRNYLVSMSLATIMNHIEENGSRSLFKVKVLKLCKFDILYIADDIMGLLTTEKVNI